MKITDLSGSVSLFPNPAVDKASIVINSNVNNGTAQVRIMDTQGRPVSSRKITLARGTNTIDLGVPAQWPPGLYVVQVSAGDESVTEKLVLRR